MRPWSNVVAVCFIVLLSTLASAQNAPPEKPQSGKSAKAQPGRENDGAWSSNAALDALLKVLHATRSTKLYGGPDIHCKTGTDCPVSISVTEYFDKPAGKLIGCAIGLGDIHIQKVSGNKTDIMVTITQPAGSAAKYTFGDVGVIIIRNDDSMASKKSMSDSELDMTARYKKGNIAVYYPLVWQSTGGNPTLCGAGDPQIVND